MQQVTTFEAGERDYVNIRGDTGPLVCAVSLLLVYAVSEQVYPAGFLYLFSWLKGKTDSGTDIMLDPTAPVSLMRPGRGSTSSCASTSSTLWLSFGSTAVPRCDSRRPVLILTSAGPTVGDGAPACVKARAFHFCSTLVQ